MTWIGNQWPRYSTDGLDQQQGGDCKLQGGSSLVETNSTVPKYLTYTPIHHHPLFDLNPTKSGLHNPIVYPPDKGIYIDSMNPATTTPPTPLLLPLPLPFYCPYHSHPTALTTTHSYFPLYTLPTPHPYFPWLLTNHTPPFLLPSLHPYLLPILTPPYYSPFLLPSLLHFPIPMYSQLSFHSS